MTMQSTLTLRILTYGIAIVISFLVAIMIKGIHFFMNLGKEKTQPQAAVEPIAVPVAGQELPPEVVVVIAAAVTSMLGPRARIKRIHYRNNGPGTGWSLQGRMSIFTSHTIKR